MIIRASVMALAIAAAAPSSAEECPLEGRWKSDAARTLAEVATELEARPEAMNVLSADPFGHMNHDWTCTDLVAWLDDDEPGEPISYRIVGRDSESMLVTFFSGAENDLLVVFEGECYKIQFQGQSYREHFCPLRE